MALYASTETIFYLNIWEQLKMLSLWRPPLPKLRERG